MLMNVVSVLSLAALVLFYRVLSLPAYFHPRRLLTFTSVQAQPRSYYARAVVIVDEARSHYAPIAAMRLGCGKTRQKQKR